MDVVKGNGLEDEKTFNIETEVVDHVDLQRLQQRVQGKTLRQSLGEKRSRPQACSE